MKERTKEILANFLASYPNLGEIRSDVLSSMKNIVDAYYAGGKVVVCGNGGSAADSEHIVGELMKGFRLKRPIDTFMRNQLKNTYPEFGDYIADNLQIPIPAISLVNQTVLMTALCNDLEPDMFFAQQVYGYCRKEDILLTVSTSGNSKNVIYAAMLAKAIGAKIIAFTNKNGGKLAEIADVTIKVPAIKTFAVQELHLPVYHALCLMVESELFDS